MPFLGMPLDPSKTSLFLERWGLASCSNLTLISTKWHVVRGGVRQKVAWQGSPTRWCGSLEKATWHVTVATVTTADGWTKFELEKVKGTHLTTHTPLTLSDFADPHPVQPDWPPTKPLPRESNSGRFSVIFDGFRPILAKKGQNRLAIGSSKGGCSFT